MKYFECNLPTSAPYWMHTAVAGDFNRTLAAIHSRMDRLNDALDLSGMDGATFSKHARVLFDNRTELFDHYSASDIVQFVRFIDDGQKAEPRMEWPNATVIVDTAFVSKKEWESLRHFGIGGSDAAVVLGISPYQTGSGLYHDKVGTPVKLNPAENNGWVFERGHMLERKVIEAFCRTTGAVPIPETWMFASKKHPCCLANIDQIVRFSDGRLFVFEAKTTVADNWQAWSGEKIPAQYVPQTRQYPAVLDDERICGTYIGCIFTNDTVIGGKYVCSDYDEQKFVCRFVERDKDSEEELLATEETWFQDYIECNEEPPLSGKPSDPAHPDAGELQVIRKFSGPADPSLAVDIWEADEYSAEIQQFLQAKEDMSKLQKSLKALDEVAKAASVPMIARLGTTVEANVDNGDGTYFEIKNAPRQKTTVDRESLSVLIDALQPYIPTEMIDKLRGCVKTEPESFRVFSIKRKPMRKPLRANATT